jgi:hypothetical protein
MNGDNVSVCEVPVYSDSSAESLETVFCCYDAVKFPVGWIPPLQRSIASMST